MRPRVLVLLAMGTVMAVSGCTPAPPPAAPLPPPGAAGGEPRTAVGDAPAPPVDVLVGTDLIAVDGRRTSLAWAGEGVTAYRIPAGLLVLASYPRSAAWLVTGDGVRHSLIVGDPDEPGAVPIVSPDGTRLAYRAGRELVLARFDGPRLTTIARSGPIGVFWPSRFLGDGILLSYTVTGGGPDGYDIWYPGRGAYRPSAVTPTMEIGASTADGRTLLASVPSDGAPCLAWFDSQRVLGRAAGTPAATASKTVCGLGLLSGAWPISPDGRFLLGHLTGTKGLGRNPGPTTNTGNPVAVIDLGRGGVLVRTWPDEFSRTILLNWPVVWLDPGTVVVSGGGGVARLRLNAAEIEWIPLATAGTDGVMPTATPVSTLGLA